MKYCNNCGRGLDDNTIFCPNCGARANGDGPQINFDNFGGGYGHFGGYGYGPIDTAPSKFLAVMSFIFWWLGLAVWAFCRHTRPGKANSALKGLLSSACVSMPIVGAVLWVLWKDDPAKRDFAKIGAISAIVGAGIYVFFALLSIILTLTGALDAGFYVPLMSAVVHG